MFDHILRHAESSILKLRVRYLSFIFEILMDQHVSMFLQIDTFSGPPSKIRQNLKLLWGLYKIDSPQEKGCEDPAFTDDSTYAPSPMPPSTDP